MNRLDRGKWGLDIQFSNEKYVIQMVEEIKVLDLVRCMNRKRDGDLRGI